MVKWSRGEVYVSGKPIMLREWYSRYDIVVKGVACKSGCSYCCYIPVICTEIEAREAFGANPHVRERVLSHKNRDFEPCPFLDLKSKSCTVYEVRPTSCRQYTSFSRSKCKVAHKRRDAMASIPSDGNNYFYWQYLAKELPGPRKSLVEWIRSF